VKDRKNVIQSSLSTNRNSLRKPFEL